MTKQALEKEADNWCFRKKYTRGYSYIYAQIRDAYICGAEPREKRIAELEAQIEKLIDFVLLKTECCDVCPITDTCINSEGTCPYAGILSKGEEAVTREWLMQKIEKGVKNDKRRT